MQKTQQKGFTIIEVVLVLAIAGLIFLMVFLAFPALQKNQRDAQRRADASKFISQLQSYRTDNKGKLPETTAAGTNAYVAKYLPDWKDPVTQSTYDRKTSEADLLKAGDWLWDKGSMCDSTVTGASHAYIKMKMESGETCQDL